MIEIDKPYVLFLANAPDSLSAKTARGIADWRPDQCLGQIRFEGCQADLGLNDMTLTEAKSAGAKTLIIGVANRGGVIDPGWINFLIEALQLGFDLASGLHQKLKDIAALSKNAANLNRQLHDVRHANGPFSVGTGRKRAGKRLLPVGTDCSCGKMYTALSIEREMRLRGAKATFRATGQTGILIAGAGISVDAVPADFISGVVEELSPDNDLDHWDLVEGQGSLFHPSFAGVSLGLVHGTQPDALILCHEPTRTHMRGLPDFLLPGLSECMCINLNAARLTNPSASFVGICINTAALSDADARAYLGSLEQEFSLPATDPYRYGVTDIVDQLI